MRIGVIPLVTAAVVDGGCGAAQHQSMLPASNPAGSPAGVRPLHLKPGGYTFHLGSDVRVGQRILCVTHSGRLAGGGGVQPRGQGVGSSTGFEATTFTNGRVQVVCPAHPGNA